MLGVVIIAVVFTGLAILIAWGAARGKLKGLNKIVEPGSSGGKRTLNLSLIFTYIAFGLAVPIIFVVGNRSNSNSQVGGIKLTAAMQSGRELFGEHCAVCHTLSADNAIGKTGPNLDTIPTAKSKATILYTIKHGCVQDPQAAGPSNTEGTCLGYGTMPADIVSGQQAQDIAEFVAKVSGHT
jgi:mono/diheme cytochrome c family protein